MSEYVVTVVGLDRPGIIAAVTGALAGLGGNLEDSSMTILRGHFAMSLVVNVDREPEAVAEALAPACRELGVHCAVEPAEPAAAPVAAEPRHYLLSVHGGDRPGIVAAVTGLLARRGGNITDLTTRLTDDLYLLVCEVDVPDDLDVAGLGRELADLAGSLGVHVTLRPVETDVL